MIIQSVRDFPSEWILKSFPDKDLGHSTYSRTTIIEIPEDDFEIIESLSFEIKEDFAFPAKVIRIIDGDSWVLETLHQRIVIRIANNSAMCIETVRVDKHRHVSVNTPETFRVKKDSEEYARGMAATQFVKDWSSKGVGISAVTYKSNQGKYRRYLTELVREDGSVLGEALLESGHGSRYID